MRVSSGGDPSEFPQRRIVELQSAGVRIRCVSLNCDNECCWRLQLRLRLRLWVERLARGDARFHLMNRIVSSLVTVKIARRIERWMTQMQPIRWRT